MVQKGISRDEALFALAAAYRSFSREHAGLYKVTMALPSLQEEAGFFRQSPVSVEASYQAAIRCFLNGLIAETGGNHIFLEPK